MRKFLKIILWIVGVFIGFVVLIAILGGLGLLDEEKTYNVELFEKCKAEVIDIINDGMVVIDDKVNVSFLSETTGSNISMELQAEYDVNPIRNIHYKDNFKCVETGNKIEVKILSSNGESAPCPDGSNPPLGMRCKTERLKK